MASILAILDAIIITENRESLKHAIQTESAKSSARTLNKTRELITQTVATHTRRSYAQYNNNQGGQKTSRNDQQDYGEAGRTTHESHRDSF